MSSSTSSGSRPIASIDLSTSMAASVVSGSSRGGSMERIWSLLMLHILSVCAPAVTVAMPATLPAGADVDDPRDASIRTRLATRLGASLGSSGEPVRRSAPTRRVGVRDGHPPLGGGVTGRRAGSRVVRRGPERLHHARGVHVDAGRGVRSTEHPALRPAHRRNATRRHDARRPRARASLGAGLGSMAGEPDRTDRAARAASGGTRSTPARCRLTARSVRATRRTDALARRSPPRSARKGERS